jgi:uncharacterized delta-60 repeat protein
MFPKISSLTAYLVTASLFAPALVSAFGDDLLLPLDRRITSLAVQGSGQVLVAQDNGIARLGVDGGLEATLRLSGGPDLLAAENEGTVLAHRLSTISRIDMDRAQQSTFAGQISSFVLQPDGKIVALIKSPPASDFPYTISRLNPDSTLDPSFTNTPFAPSSMTALALQEDGKLVVAVATNGALARFDRDGNPDVAFNPPQLTPALVRSMVVQADHKIIVGGNFQEAGGELRHGLLRLNSDGTLDTAFTPGFTTSTQIDSIALQADGKVILAGTFNLISGETVPNIIRLNSDGTLDSSFAVATPDPGPSVPLILLGDGTVVAGLGTHLLRMPNPDSASQALIREGSTLTWLRGGSSPEIYLARFQASLDGIQWTDLGAADRINGGWRLQDAPIPADARLRARGYVTGTSHHVDHVPGAPAIYSQPVDRTVNVGTNVAFHIAVQGLEPMEIQWFKDAQPLAAPNAPTLLLTNVNGGFTGVYSATVANSQGFSSNRVGQLTVVDPIILSHPNSIWINVGSSTNLGVEAVGTGLTYQWRKDGQDIPGANSPSLQFANLSATETGAYQVLITGEYGALESALVAVRVNEALPDANFRPAWEATTEWFPIQSSVASNNTLFVGGTFRMLDVPQLRDLVKLSPDGSVDPSFAPELTGGDLGGVTALATTPNGQLLVGGNFTHVNGRVQPLLARLNGDGSLDEQFRPEITGMNHGTYSQVTSIEVLADDRILIGGDFGTVEGINRPGLALLQPDGRLDESFNPDPSHVPHITWGTIVQPNSGIIAYGWNYRRFLSDGTADFDFTEAVTASSFRLLPLANGALFVNSPQGATLIERDGNPDPSFSAPFISSVELEQANGQIIFRQSGPLGTSLHRMRLDETVDPGLSPLFDNFALHKAMRSDGSMLVAGAFSNVAGFHLPKLALIRNTSPAVQVLTFDGTNARWFRDSTSPEVIRTTFEFSTDGVLWSHLGAGSRFAGGWLLEGLRLNSAGKLRARGFFRGSTYDTTIDVLHGLKLEAPHHDPHKGELVLSATTPGDQTILLQTSTDLRHWTNLQTNASASQQWHLALTNLIAPHGFYRLIQAIHD